MSDLEALEARVQGLERSRRVIIAIGVIALVAVAVVAGLQSTQAELTRDEVRARALVLVDRSGAERATLRMGVGDEPRLELKASNGQTRISVGTGPQGEASVVLRQPEGRAGAVVQVRPDGSAEVGVLDSGGQRLVSLGSSGAGAAGLELFADGQRRGTLLADGSVGLNLADGSGTTRARVAVAPDGRVDLLGMEGP